jgi:hypothetical protein
VRALGLGVVVVLVTTALVVLAAMLAARQERGKRPDPIVELRRQLASGEITEQQFWERESALRASEPRRRRR